MAGKRDKEGKKSGLLIRERHGARRHVRRIDNYPACDPVVCNGCGKQRESGSRRNRVDLADVSWGKKMHCNSDEIE